MRWPLSTVAVVEQSMAPALRPGDWLLVWRGLRSGRPPRVRPGQLVVAWHPDRTDFLLVKRAIRRTGVAGGWNRTIRAWARWTAGRSAPCPAA